MTEENTNDGAEAGDSFKAITSQDQLDRLIGERINKVKAQFADYDDLKTKASKFDDAEQASKTELQRITEDRDTHKVRGDTAELNAARLEVALTKGLTASQAKRLIGTNKAEFEADADEMLADLGKKGSAKPDPKNLKSGATGSGSASTGRERAAAALRQLRGTN